MHRIDGAGHVNNMFVTEDVGLNRPPTEVTADILNALQEELASFVTWSGLQLNKADNTQLRQALLAKFALSADAITLPTVQAGAYVAATSAGSADAITAAFAPAVAALTAGMVLYVRASAPNATATPTFSPNGLAARAIVKGNNLPLVAGDIAGAGHWLALQYDATLLKWVLVNPASGVASVVPQASAAEVTAESAVPKYISPDLLANSRRVAKAWVNFNGTLSGAIAPRASLNVVSVTKNGTGDYTVNFSAPLTDTNYTANITSRMAGPSTGTAPVPRAGDTKTASAYRFINTEFTNGVATALTDSSEVDAVFYR